MKSRENSKMRAKNNRRRKSKTQPPKNPRKNGNAMYEVKEALENHG